MAIERPEFYSKLKTSYLAGKEETEMIKTTFFIGPNNKKSSLKVPKYATGRTSKMMLFDEENKDNNETFIKSQEEYSQERIEIVEEILLKQHKVIEALESKIQKYDEILTLFYIFLRLEELIEEQQSEKLEMVKDNSADCLLNQKNLNSFFD